MGRAAEGALAPTPHYYQLQGRAAEIARALGSPAGGAEHLFLGMLHDGGWPVSVISPLADLGRAEAAVLAVLSSPGYSPPPAPRPPVRDYVQPWGADVAAGMGDSYIGAEHALLAMIRARDTVPARALATLADLDAVEAAIVAAKNAPNGPPPDAVYLPVGQPLDGPLERAIIDALPEGATFGINTDADRRVWICVFRPGASWDQALTREVLNTALTSLGRAEGR